MDCATRVSGLAVVTTLCIGGTALLIWWVVDLAQQHGKGGALGVLCVLLVFWVGVSACICPAFCAVFFPWSTVGLYHLDNPLLRPFRSCLGGVARLLGSLCRDANDTATEMIINSVLSASGTQEPAAAAMALYCHSSWRAHKAIS
ncbi:hypothetical protein PR202_ga07046 [Eleusine coracana subsp. coracana]|uniref:Uncharacterized protein n=1 Tax=Eleusine coracana subsp. coracana TaxID=191504 RepID=A0AAV5BYV3_ELECO|nr:hypothetical protein PR202_ga07046 [Eleusine coracana subsp. coracana]